MSIIKNTEELNNLLDAVQNLPVKKDEQEKTVDITENGTTVVTPDEGMTLGGVTVNVEVESSGGEDTLRALFTETLTEFSIPDRVSTNSRRLCCASLIRFVVPNLYGTLNSYFFYLCRNIQHIDVGNITKVDPLAINGCHKINTFIMRNTEQVVSLTGTFSNTNSILKDDYYADGNYYYCYFYVPKALIEDYKVATNWSNYANRFRTIEDYPEIIGGII